VAVCSFPHGLGRQVGQNSSGPLRSVPSLKVHVFHQLCTICLSEQNEPNSTLNNLNCRKYYFQKLSQFSKGNNMLVAAASNIDGIFVVVHVFLQLLNRPILFKQCQSPP
jgi:hypothetical protein